MNLKSDTLRVSSNPLDINRTYVINFLKNSYWAKDRSVASIEQSINNSFCFSLLLEGQQIGFARVITDQAVFAYLMDVFVDPVYQGKGYGSFLMEQVLKDQALMNVDCLRLATLDAHAFYERKGFKKITHPEYLLERKKPKKIK